MNKLVEIEGIVLKAIDYLEYDKILHVFTNEGVKHFIVKGAKKVKSKHFSNATPLILAKFLYLERERVQIYLCTEISPIDHYLFLRKDLSKLKAACSMCYNLYKTQLPDCPAPELFNLFKRFLNKLECIEKVESLILSFQLKVLKHDGLISFPLQKIKSFHAFTLDELQVLNLLGDGKNLDEIARLNISKEFRTKVDFVMEKNGYCLYHLPFRGGSS